jgi:hypothetical protein
MESSILGRILPMPNFCFRLKNMNRKEFLKTGGRLILLGGITVSTGYLIINRKVSAKCSVSATCNNCGKFSECELPQAKEIRDGKK